MLKIKLAELDVPSGYWLQNGVQTLEDDNKCLSDYLIGSNSHIFVLYRVLGGLNYLLTDC